MCPLLSAGVHPSLTATPSGGASHLQGAGARAAASGPGPSAGHGPSRAQPGCPGFTSGGFGGKGPGRDHPCVLNSLGPPACQGLGCSMSHPAPGGPAAGAPRVGWGPHAVPKEAASGSCWGRARAPRSPHPSLRVLGAVAGGEEPGEGFCALGLAWPFLWAWMKGQGWPQVPSHAQGTL